MELYRLVQAQQHELARLPTGQPVSRSFLDRLAIGVAVPLSPFAAEIAKDAAILYASAQLYQLGQRLEDREMGVPELYRYPREVRKRVRAAYPALKAEMRRQEAEKRRQEKEERQRHEQLLTQKYGKRWQTHGKKWWQV
ncbi:hypothetical protein AU193_22365 [Mycobacterium sp. GA-1285]|nr:hypothetical protein AU193_22365 [Mycobacterium sp. GA-1285]